MQSGYIEYLQIQTKKGVPFEKVTSIKLLAGKGIEGDCHALGTEKQVTLLSAKATQWISEQELQGLCFQNFKGNIITNGIDYSMICPGDILVNGKAMLEITSCSKQCYSECKRMEHSLSCKLITGILYAKVIQSGHISVGDSMWKTSKNQNMA